MTGGFLFTLFTLPLHNSRLGEENVLNTHSDSKSGITPSHAAASVSLSPAVQIMQTDNRRNGFFIKKHIPNDEPDRLIQIVFQYEEFHKPARKYYQSFAIKISDERYANTQYVDFRGPFSFGSSDRASAKNYFSLEFNAPYPFYAPVKSFSDYEQKIDRHIDFASDLTLTNMPEDEENKNYHNINVCDNYRLVQELLSRLNGSFCYENRSLLQDEVYLYIHSYDKNFVGTPEQQMRQTVKKYRISRIKMKLLDWKCSFDNPSGKKGDLQNLMIGPRKAEFRLYVDRILDPKNFTIYDKDIRSPLFLWKDDFVNRKVHSAPEKEEHSNLGDSENEDNDAEDIKDNLDNVNDGVEENKDNVDAMNNTVSNNEEKSSDNLDDVSDNDKELSRKDTPQHQSDKVNNYVGNKKSNNAHNNARFADEDRVEYPLRSEVEENHSGGNLDSKSNTSVADMIRNMPSNGGDEESENKNGSIIDLESFL